MTCAEDGTTMKYMNNPSVIAAIAIIKRKGKILIARRQKNDPLKGKWEFPGGKITGGETHEQCLRREIREELDIDIEVGNLLYSTKHTYNHIAVELFFYNATYLSGEIKTTEYSDILWVEKTDLQKYTFPEANFPLLQTFIEE